jgi:hypothetical protein
MNDDKSNKWDPTIRLCNDCHWYAPIDDDKEEWIGLLGPLRFS